MITEPVPNITVAELYNELMEHPFCRGRHDALHEDASFMQGIYHIMEIIAFAANKEEEWNDIFFSGMIETKKRIEELKS